MLTDLHLLAQLNTAENMLDQAQAAIDAARASFAHDGAFQYKMDQAQTHLDIQRKRVMDSKKLFVNPN